MRYYLSGYIIILAVSVGCTTSGNHDLKKDSAATKPESAEGSPGTNLVKSEAPDATTKTEQGYALPRYEDGLEQSPINILSDSAVKDSSQAIEIKFNAGVITIQNLGHTIQLDFKNGSIALAGNKTYSPKQFHFHTPSEHLIDGITYPMEMHIVNILKDSGEKEKPKYLVVALLFKMGHESKFIKKFLQSVPGEEKKDTLRESVVLDDLFKTIPKYESSSYYTYKGSLTTPPYTETVAWVVRKSILEASPEQIYTIEKMEGNNARHVQALYKRQVQSH